MPRRNSKLWGATSPIRTIGGAPLDAVHDLLTAFIPGYRTEGYSLVKFSGLYGLVDITVELRAPGGTYTTHFLPRKEIEDWLDRHHPDWRQGFSKR